jgi:hypothetical protein
VKKGKRGEKEKRRRGEKEKRRRGDFLCGLAVWRKSENPPPQTQRRRAAIQL